MEDDRIVLQLVVAHEPQQVGSKNAYVVYSDKARKIPARRQDGSIIVNVTDENAKAKPYMNAVWAKASAAWQHGCVMGVGFELEVDFYVKRPETHWGTGRNAHLLKPSAPARPLTTPDEDKLLRCTQDALTGVVWKDDNQVVEAVARKFYAVPNRNNDGQGAIITIRRCAQQLASDLPVEHQSRVVPGRAPEAADEQLALA